MKFADFLNENIQKQADDTADKENKTVPATVEKEKSPVKGETEKATDDKAAEAESEETEEEKKKKKEEEERKKKKKVSGSDNEEYDVRDLKESFDKDFQHKIEGYIVDACREMKISIRAVEFEDNGVVVHYSYGKEAPQNFRDDKNELAKDIRAEVTDIFDEQGYKIKTVLRSTVQDGVGTLTFFVIKPEKDAK